MSARREGELCDSLLTWMQTFQVSGPCSSYEDLTGGIAISQVLHVIDSSWFNDAWLMRIKKDTGENWRLKVSNLKRILQSVLEYYQDVLGHPVSDDHIPDVGLIGEFSNVAELRKMVQLVLGCAISCDKKEEHIQQIMTLGESVQQAVMESIQELLSKDPPDTVTGDTYVNYDSQSRKYYFISEDTDEKNEILQRCHDLEQQVSLLLEEKKGLVTENRALRDQQDHSEGGMGTSSMFNKKMLLLQTQIEQLQEENYRLESARDDYRQRCDELDREVQELHQRNLDLTGLAHEAQALRDEMDVLRHSSDRVGKLETLVESYKKKLEDLGDLRRQVKLLEERNTVYMQRTCQLEDELHKAHASRAQVETLNRQNQELQKKHSAESMRAEKWQFEFMTLREKFEALQKERERLLIERDSLRETNDELRCSHLQQTCLVQSDAMLSGPSPPLENLAAEILPAELKESVVRLQQENKMLCVQEASYQERLCELENLLEESNRSKNRLESENRLNQQQILELRALIEELQRRLQEHGNREEDSSILKRKLDEHLEMLHEAHSELQKKREYIETLEPKADLNMSRKVDELQQILRQKDEDMRVMEERYKRYVDKARTVIKTLDPKQQNYIPPEIQALKNQLHEKDTRIRHLEKDFEKTKSQRDQEEKLIISAWYNMGMSLQQKVVDERTSAPSGAQSFLAQQRLATNARRGLISRSHSHLPRYINSDKQLNLS
ncbi:Hook homolog 2 isoform X2 [Pelobates cultripes]|uniref:Hook homolog 2 isoform X2 n=2 Tax=Pelobates cultripes TaxID=61616 RepID=A0AAD1RJL1_PELCU|nr:Hook homolog 2 isoform X2 [Pelobates cultripes]